MISCTSTRHNGLRGRHFLALLVALVMVSAACGDNADSSEARAASTSTTTTSVTSTSTPTTSTPTTSTTEPATDSPPCGVQFDAGFSSVECQDMTFELSIPENCLEDSCGLIVDVHSDRGTAELAAGSTALRQLGNAAGYVVVHPESPSTSWWLALDSVRIRAFLDELIGAIGTDTSRVHVGGASGGGYMTWQFVCDHADLIASAAPLAAGAGSDPSASCEFDADRSPAEEVDILQFHGVNDRLVAFDTALAQRDLVVEHWDMTETETLADEPTYRWTRWLSAQGTVFEFVEFDWMSNETYGGHCYPGASGRGGCGADTPVNYGEAALEFYIAHPKDT